MNYNDKKPSFDENAFALSIKHALNEQAQALPQATLDKLYAARRLATAQRKTNVTQNTVLHSFSRFAQSLLSPMALAAPALVVGVGLFVMSSNNADNYVQTVAEIDSQVLTQDLPIDALLDKGFVRYVQVGE
jgi:Protein of unknown function (DUF3619)